MRVSDYALLLLALVSAAGCRTGKTAPVASSSFTTPSPATSVANQVSTPQQLANPAQPSAPAVTPVSFNAPTNQPPQFTPPASTAPTPSEIVNLPPDASIDRELMPIDLPTALRLASGSNYQVAHAREQINQAWARADAASVLWLPTIRGGLGYNKHEGQIQDIVGQVFPKSRGNVWSGLGAAVPGAGSPVYPGVSANFHLAEAIFEPLAARQSAAAKRHAADAVANDVLLRVALAYLELARTAEEVAIAQATIDTHQELVRLTEAYARTGQGAQAEADRANTELAFRRNDHWRATEAQRVAAARLAQLIRLDAQVMLEPLDPLTVPLEIVPAEVPVGELVAQGLALRPELAESRHLVSQAVQKMRREQYSVLLPSVVLGMSYGGFGGGQGSTIANYGDRMDADAIAFWQVRNLGWGDRAARQEAASIVRQQNVQQMALMDQVSREVVEAEAQVSARRAQIAIAEQAISTATRSYERNLDRIKQAQGLPIELLQAGQALAQARREYLRALIEYNAAQFTLYRAIGAPGTFAPCFVETPQQG